MEIMLAVAFMHGNDACCGIYAAEHAAVVLLACSAKVLVSDTGRLGLDRQL